jgi:hypothetical protein
MATDKKKLYAIWRGILSRCENRQDKSYARYGGRGIRVCLRWQGADGFENFLADMGERQPDYSIDRIDNDGDYEPGNCRWSSRHEQQRNTLATRWLEYQGHRRPLAEWAELYGLSVKRLRARLKAGWSLDKALSTPITLSKVRER